jgi:MarR family transcriptional regulator, organic hydroperoxide resistance regulator
MAKEIEPVPLAEHTCFALYSAHMAVQRAYKPVLDRLGLTYPQYLVMSTLWHQDGMSVGEIADHLGLESSTLTPLLQRLEAAGFVHRRRDPENERRVVISLADAGKALRKEAHCVTDRLTEASGMSGIQLGQITAAVRELQQAVEARS